MSVLGNKRSGGGGGSLSREQCHQGDDKNEDAAADADDLLTMMRTRVMMMRSNVGQGGGSGLCHYPHSTSSPTPRARQPGHSLSTVMCMNVLFYHTP